MAKAKGKFPGQIIVVMNNDVYVDEPVPIVVDGMAGDENYDGKAAAQYVLAAIGTVKVGTKMAVEFLQQKRV